MKRITFIVSLLMCVSLAQGQAVFPDFSKMHFGCDGNSITAGNQWSKTVVDLLGFATHHNVAVGSSTSVQLTQIHSFLWMGNIPL